MEPMRAPEPPPIPARPTRQWYQEVYLRSEWWSYISGVARSVQGNFCHNPSCEDPEYPMVVHHLHDYKDKDGASTLGREDPVRDLVVICSLCHEYEHPEFWEEP